MESNIFSWEDYKLLDNLRVRFFACTLKKELFIQGQATGWFGGTKIKEILIDYLNGSITFLDYEEGDCVELETFKAELLMLGNA